MLYKSERIVGFQFSDFTKKNMLIKKKYYIDSLAVGFVVLYDCLAGKVNLDVTPFRKTEELTPKRPNKNIGHISE